MEHKGCSQCMRVVLAAAAVVLVGVSCMSDSSKGDCMAADELVLCEVVVRADFWSWLSTSAIAAAVNLWCAVVCLNPCVALYSTEPMCLAVVAQ